MFRALALAALLAACTVDRTIPSARLGCKDDSACPPGYLCRPTAGRMVCCLGGSCGPAGATDASGETAPPAPDGSGSSGDTGGIPAADAGCSGSGCAVALVVQGLDERDLATGCSGDLCVVGGITP
jgi:hypothetical protein